MFKYTIIYKVINGDETKTYTYETTFGRENMFCVASRELEAYLPSNANYKIIKIISH